MIPRESGPKASSKVEKETFPRERLAGRLGLIEGGLPVFKSSRLTVTASEDIMPKGNQEDMIKFLNSKTLGNLKVFWGGVANNERGSSSFLPRWLASFPC